MLSGRRIIRKSGEGFRRVRQRAVQVVVVEWDLCDDENGDAGPWRSLATAIVTVEGNGAIEWSRRSTYGANHWEKGLCEKFLAYVQSHREEWPKWLDASASV